MMKDLPDYLQSVRFECTNCGACCTGAPGRVRVSEAEIRQIEEALGEKVSDQMPSWVFRAGTEWRLRERENGDCVFFRDNRCSIHAVKPGQCRRYPFWFSNVRSEAAWQKTCGECPGIGEGPVWDGAEILKRVQEDLESQ
jgi:Fe-S-cluster containining protein